MSKVNLINKHLQSTYGGRQCNQCADGYYNFEAGCLPCLCDVQGTESGTTCNKITGKIMTTNVLSNFLRQGSKLFCQPINFYKILTTYL